MVLLTVGGGVLVLIGLVVLWFVGKAFREELSLGLVLLLLLVCRFE